MISDRYTRDELGRPLLDGRPVDRPRSEPRCDCAMARYRVARAAHRAARRFRGEDPTRFAPFARGLEGEARRRFARHYYAQLAREANYDGPR